MKTGLLAIALGVCVGCGSSDAVDDWVPDDIDREAALDQIGTTGFARLCSAFEDYVLDMYRDSYLVQAVCTAIAIESTTSATECGDQAVACYENPPAEAEAMLDQILAQAGCTTVAVEPTGCSATVADMKECLEGLGTEVDQIQFTLTCAAAGQMLDDSWWQIDLPGACSNLQTLCP